MNKHDKPSGNFNVAREKSSDCGLVPINKVVASTREQLARIFLEPQFEGYEPTVVSFSKNQTDHVVLELAFFRLQRSIPKVEFTIKKGITAQIDGIIQVQLPTQEDPNKKIGTVILVHKELEPTDFQAFQRNLNQASEAIRDQLT